MTHPQNDDLISGQIENHAIVAYPEAVGSEIWVSQLFSTREGVFFVPLKVFPIRRLVAGSMASRSLTARRVYVSR
jgi:hypothetical protein